MSRSRRLWLFSPLVVLTLFFAALGWRNWHVPMDEEEVMAAVVADYRLSMQRPTDIVNKVTGRLSCPFSDEEMTVVSRKRGEFSEPISAALMTRLKQSYPRARLFNASDVHRSPECSFSFEKIQIINRFQAKCVVFYTLKAPANLAHADYRETFTFKRSPINFQESGWQIEESDNNQLPLPSGCIGCIP